MLKVAKKKCSLIEIILRIIYFIAKIQNLQIILIEIKIFYKQRLFLFVESCCWWVSVVEISIRASQKHKYFLATIPFQLVLWSCNLVADSFAKYILALSLYNVPLKKDYRQEGSIMLL